MELARELVLKSFELAQELAEEPAKAWAQESVLGWVLGLELESLELAK